MFYYVYCITNLVTGKKYIGSRTSRIEPEFDLGYVYKSSSHNIEFINDLKTNPTCYKFEILKTFQTSYDKIQYESYLHKVFNVAKCDMFYNLARQRSSGFTTDGNHNCGNARCKDLRKLSISISKGLKNSVKLKRRKELHEKELKEQEKQYPQFCFKGHIITPSRRTRKYYKCKICGVESPYKFCCSKTCFNKYIKMINNEYSDILSQTRTRYIKENYDKICKINQNIAAHVDQKAKGLKISKTKRERYKIRTGGQEANRQIRIYDANDNLVGICNRNEQFNKYCEKHGYPLNKFMYSYRRNKKITDKNFYNWYCIKDIFND